MTVVTLPMPSLTVITWFVPPRLVSSPADEGEATSMSDLGVATDGAVGTKWETAFTCVSANMKFSCTN